MSTPLTEHDRAVVGEALAEIRDAPPPRDYGYLGCPLVMFGVLLLVVFAAAATRLGLQGGALATGVLVTGIAVVVVGTVLALTAGGFARGASIAAAEAALRELEGRDGADGDRETALRAATLLLAHAVAVYGPTSSASFEPAEAAKRLGRSLELVIAVERHILEHDGGIYPVFTRGEAGPAGEYEEASGAG